MRQERVVVDVHAEVMARLLNTRPFVGLPPFDCHSCGHVRAWHRMESPVCIASGCDCATFDPGANS